MARPAQKYFKEDRNCPELATLPEGWKCRDGLSYPTVINLTEGKKLKVANYEAHHQFINAIFVDKKSTEEAIKSL